MSENNIDFELKKGIVSIETYKTLLNAEFYGTATPMQWLIARLAIIQNMVKSGIYIEFETNYENGTIKSEKEYFEWCEKNFPSAYRIIK